MYETHRPQSQLQNPAPLGGAGWNLMLHLFLACAAIWAIAPLAARAEISVQADVSQHLLTLGASVEYSVTVTGANERINQQDLSIPLNPTFDGFQIEPGSPASFTRQNWINGQVTEERRLTWHVTAIREGVAKIGSIQITYGGRTFKTPELSVKVMRDQAQAAAGQPAEPGMAGILPAQTDYENLTQQLKGRLFARMTISNPNPYLQETVVVSCKVYIDPQIAGQITNVDWTAPSWVDFFAQRLKQGQLDLKPETFNDKEYRVVTVAQVLLAPTRPGKIELSLSMAEAAVRVRTAPQSEDQFFNDSFFGSSFFDRAVAAKLPIAPATFDVKPLPAEGRPASFQNGVGSFAFAASVDRREMTQDDLLTLRLEVGGEGYLGSVIQPNLPSLPEWSRAVSQSRIEGPDELKTFRGKKIFEVLLRPEQTGVLTIPPIAYAFFDPGQGKYIEQKSESFTVRVSKGSEQRLLVSAASPTSGSTERSPQFFGEQLAYIHTDFPGSIPDAAIYEEPVFLVFQTLPLALIGLAMGVRARRRYVAGHLGTLQRRSAGSRARRELREAQLALGANNALAFHAKLAEAVRTYLATKMGRSASGLTLEEIESACLSRGVDLERARSICRILEQCDQARYLGAGAGTQESMRGVLEESEILLRHLDKHFV